MSHKKYSKLKYTKERTILSDVLPYETPLIFSNRYFYRFLTQYHISFNNETIEWQSSSQDQTLEEIISLLFGIKKKRNIEEKDIGNNKKLFNFSRNNKSVSFISIPFAYKIAHKETEYRELAIPHPRNQLQMIAFYDHYKELILYYCSLSSFSIRKPHRIAKSLFFKDKTHYTNLSKEESKLEQHDQEYENLKSFFVYKDYSNIYKFYESYQFHRCEKKYNHLMTLDISKCFDSLYTHSISWALLSKNIVKEKLPESKKTFAGLFDKLMQQLNYNETNGIIIGPEFSRIFAELILQSVDHELARILNKKYKHKVDYEIFRYVDDYFIFYNDDLIKEYIVKHLQLSLKEYKLYLNSEKQVIYNKPIITEITIAKQRVKELFNQKLVLQLREETSNPEDNDKKQYTGYIKIYSNSLITKFKIIIKECNVEYRDILNYSLSIIESQAKKILKDYEKTQKNEEQLIAAILEIIEFVFFIYSVSPRVNTTIKLCRILATVIYFAKEEDIRFDLRDVMFKSIFDQTNFILDKNKHDENTQVETLYLLVVLSELGKNYWLDDKKLCGYFGIEMTENNEFVSNKNFNYFSFVILLFYMKDKVRYSGIREFIEKKINETFENKKTLIHKDAELMLLLMDTLACPYLSDQMKKNLLEKYDVTDTNLQTNIINKSKKQQWFVTWNKFDFRKELDAKRSKEVY
jgi:hypothetical protein